MNSLRNKKQQLMTVYHVHKGKKSFLNNPDNSDDVCYPLATPLLPPEMLNYIRDRWDFVPSSNKVINGMNEAQSEEQNCSQLFNE